MSPSSISSAERLLDSLTDWQLAHGASYCSALIDVSRFPDPASCAQALQMELEIFEALPNVYEAFSPTLKSRGPRLYSAPLVEPHWHGICAATLDQRAASFTLHDCPVGAVVTHLKSMTKLQHPGGAKRLFRFQDSTVLSQLIPLLTDRQRRALLGPIRRWQVLDVCAHPVEMGVSAGTSTGSSATLTLDERQIDALAARLRPATIIAQANETDGALLYGKSRCEQWRLVQAASQRASDHGLTLNEDIALFCILSLQLPAGFDRDGPVARAIERSKRHGIGFGEAIDRVPVQEWRAWDEQLDKMEGLQ